MQAGLSQATATGQRVAISLQILLLLAILVALAITLVSVQASVRILAGAVVLPIIALTVLLLFVERQGKPWGYAGAATLGAIGVALRLIVSTQPRLEVGGGLPPVVTATYLGLGAAVIVSSLWVYLETRCPTQETPQRNKMAP